MMMGPDEFAHLYHALSTLTNFVAFLCGLVVWNA